MAALAGIVSLNPQRWVREEDVLQMLRAMRPGLPCTTETFVSPDRSAGIGKLTYRPESACARKLAQPDHAAGVHAVGEIYNEEASGSCCTAAFLLHRYRQRGVEKFADGLNGSFAATIADATSGSVVLVTDHTASRPLFITLHRGLMCFASEVKGLMALSELPCRPDPLSVISLAGMSCFLGRRTVVDGVHAMDYATVCVVKDGRMRTWPYWRYEIVPGQDRGESQYRSEFTGLLRRAVERRVRSGRAAVLLSGGIDSRGIVGMLEEPSQVRAVTYTFNTRDTRPRAGDWAVAERVAKQWGMDLQVFPDRREAFAEGLETALYATDGAAASVSANGIWDAVRRGTGAEYLLVGDVSMRASPRLTSEAQVRSRARLYPLRAMPALMGLVRKETVDSLAEQSEAEIESAVARTRGGTRYDRTDELYFDQRLINFINPLRRIPAWHGMPVRNPWLDLDVLDFVRRLPPRYRARKRLFRESLADAHPALFRLPTATRAEFRPAQFRDALRLREQRDGLVSELVSHDNPLFDDLFDVRAVEALIKDVCRTERKSKWRSQFELRRMLPLSLFLTMAEVKQYFRPRAYPLYGTELLLRVLAVAIVLRHVARRWSADSRRDAGPPTLA